MWVNVTSPTTTKSPQLERINKQKERGEHVGTLILTGHSGQFRDKLFA
jgi:hypothetical protein